MFVLPRIASADLWAKFRATLLPEGGPLPGDLVVDGQHGVGTLETPSFRFVGAHLGHPWDRAFETASLFEHSFGKQRR